MYSVNETMNLCQLNSIVFVLFGPRISTNVTDQCTVMCLSLTLEQVWSEPVERSDETHPAAPSSLSEEKLQTACLQARQSDI